ncbi:MAG TPA: hypothetical protein PKI15_04180 [Candidatus Cloacimonadota bacterium]|nr:hypothetical protein [Candidatus Cloacimonadota bacterium]
MNSRDLIGIGRLGGLDPEGFFHILVKPEFRNLLKTGEEVYLIFNSDRVFYVTISDVKETENKTWIRFAEDGVVEERPQHKEVTVAIPDDEETDEDDDLEDLLGCPVYYGEVRIGKLQSYFFNNAQNVLEIETDQGIILMIPAVDYFIESMDSSGIMLRNAESLLETSGLGIRNGILTGIDAD